MGTEGPGSATTGSGVAVQDAMSMASATAAGVRLGFGAKGAEGDPKPQMFNLRLGQESRVRRMGSVYHNPRGGYSLGTDRVV